MNDLLSICIPTYNRAEILRGCLESIIPQAKKYDVPIYILDNASTDNTANVVLQFKKDYSTIFYSRTPKTMGESNFARLLKIPQSRYAWLIGDRYRLLEGAMDVVMEKLNSQTFDLIVLNSFARPGVRMVKDISRSTVYNDPNKLLSDLGWWITLLGATIWKSDIIKGGNFEKYYGTEYVQIGVIFEYLSDKKFSVYWHADPLIYGTGRTGWLDRIFEVIAVKWVNLIKSLPSPYTEEAKRKCIKDLGVKSQLFSLKGFIVLRSLRCFNFDLFKRYYSRLKYVTNVPRPLLFLISIMPPVPDAVIKKIKSARNYIEGSIQFRL